MALFNGLKVIEALSNAAGAPGFEDEVVSAARQFVPSGAKVSEDSTRNFYITRAGNSGEKPLIQLDAHSDEVAFMVHAIKPNGTLRLLPLGDWLPWNVPAHKFLVRNAEGKYIPGIVAAKPPHFMTAEEQKTPVSMESLSLDVGASSRQEAIERFKMRIGEPVVPAVSFSYDEENDLMVGKAFDCRLGCAALLGTMHALNGLELECDVIAAIAAQEEVGMRGAQITARTLKPDLAIVFEGCPADDTVVEDYMVQTAIKHGPMLRHMDARMITNPRFQRFALDLAAKEGIPVQDSVRSGSATNGASIHLSNAGVPTIVMGLPVRYIHSHYGISSFADFQNAVRLAVAICRRMTPDLIRSF